LRMPSMPPTGAPGPVYCLVGRRGHTADERELDQVCPGYDPAPGISGRQCCSSSLAFSKPSSSKGLLCPVRRWRSTVAMNSSIAAVTLSTGVGSGLPSVIQTACHGLPTALIRRDGQHLTGAANSLGYLSRATAQRYLPGLQQLMTVRGGYVALRLWALLPVAEAIEEAAEHAAFAGEGGAGRGRGRALCGDGLVVVGAGDGVDD